MLGAAVVAKAATKTGRQTKPKCIKGTACGYSCIAAKYVCSDRILKRDADALLAAIGSGQSGSPETSIYRDLEWRQPGFTYDASGRSEVAAANLATDFDEGDLAKTELAVYDGIADADDLTSVYRSYRNAADVMEQMWYLSKDSLSDRIGKATTELWENEDRILVRYPEFAPEHYADALKSEAVAWAKSQGFEPSGVNGFTAEATAAHDASHPATHRLTGLTSSEIHETFGRMLDTSGKPSLVAEEAIVNIVEHLAMGDSPEASIQNGLRVAKVLSRTQSKEAQEYVRTGEFSRSLIALTYDRIRENTEYSSILKAIQGSVIAAGTVTASGSDFTQSATTN